MLHTPVWELGRYDPPLNVDVNPCLGVSETFTFSRSDSDMPDQNRHDECDSARKYLSPNEFASATGLSISTIFRRLKAGQIQLYQPGGKRTRILIPIAAVESEPSQRQLDPDSHSAETVHSKCLASLDQKPLSGRKPKWMTEVRMQSGTQVRGEHAKSVSNTK